MFPHSNHHTADTECFHTASNRICFCFLMHTFIQDTETVFTLFQTEQSYTFTRETITSFRSPSGGQNHHIFSCQMLKWFFLLLVSFSPHHHPCHTISSPSKPPTFIFLLFLFLLFHSRADALPLLPSHLSQQLDSNWQSENTVQLTQMLTRYKQQILAKANR